MLLKPTTLAASLVVLCAMATPQVADANVSAASGASAACKASSGPGAAVFYFDSIRALNTSASTQFLTCDVPDASSTTSGGADIVELDLRFSNTTGASKDITCVFQSVAPGGVATNAIYTLTTAANSTDDHKYIFTASTLPTLPVRGDLDFYILSCSLPAGTALNMVKAYYPGTVPA